MFTSNIVEFINTTLKQSSFSDKKFQPSKLYGVSTILPRKKKKTDPLELLPAIIENSGEAKVIDLDDLHNVMIYHKMLATAHSEEKRSVGDSYDMIDVTDMAMIVFGWSNKIGCNAEQVEARIRAKFPENGSPDLTAALNLKRIKITTQATDHDKIRVFRGEFQNADYFLKPETIFFLIRYRIETRFSKACLDQCI